MSVQAGIWNFDGKPVDRNLLGEFSEALKQQGPDGEFCHVDRSIALLYRPFHSTAESRLEKQPYVSGRGFVMTWDGRLDNREELARELCHEVPATATDVALVAAAFDRWESECFRRIIGDWAVSIWNPQERELIFACDFMAIRHIFYYLKRDSVWWATDLTPLVLLSGDKFHIDDEYIAGYFAHDPEAHLTPYREIRQVPPGQFVRIRNNTRHIERYWRFTPKSRVRYKSDAEYEEHFRYVFRQSVRRRLRSDSPILAELSGGLDSSSIVCMADDILAKEGAEVPRLDTLSYYDQTEPQGDDRLYLTKVEGYRGRTGYHIDASKSGTSSTLLKCREFHVLPGYIATGCDLEAERATVVRNGGFRPVLSGIGGDEFLGGIPDPIAQLADLILQCKLLTLGKQLVAWSLVKRQPWVHLLCRSYMSLVPSIIRHYFAEEARVDPWINRHFAARTKIGKRMIDVHDHFGLWLPSRRAYSSGILLMANKLAKGQSSSLQLEEWRFPYLDRDLIEFLFSIPATQLLRPGERRSLMCRSLVQVVPSDILSRKTKQVGARTPVAGLETMMGDLQVIFDSSLTSSLGYINKTVFLNRLHAATNGQKIHIVRMFRTIALELWLRHLVSHCLLADDSAKEKRPNAIPSQAGRRRNLKQIPSPFWWWRFLERRTIR
jgi:asparagine synthase (glutamine-hydrolysing)